MMEDIPVMRPSICFDVQRIVGVSKGAGNVINYQVQWAPVWISSAHLVGCDHLIEEFYKMQPGDLGKENQNTKKLEFDKCEVQIPVKNREFSTRYSQHEILDKSFGVERDSKLSPVTANDDNIQVLVIEPEFIADTSVDENIDVMHNKHDKNRNFEWVKEKVIGGQENDMITCKDNFSSIPKENGISLVKEEVNLSHQFPDINIEDTVLVEPAEPEMYYDLNQVNMDIPSHSLKCSSCKMIFSNNKELMVHQNECHGSETKFMFNKNHASDHTAIKKTKKENDVGNIFSCQICSKTFIRESSLLSHTCRLSCPHCGKLFPSKRNLLRHIRVHTGEKPFKCDVCGLRFSRKDYLKTHLDSHITQHINNNV